ncbi:hypothetical protein ACIQVU_02275 [Lysinibacillus sp. NPDC098008]|uniref:hypothetical protein n=1 Tax=Lysinibacillus sp. NPDC098008 TaxID=3364146 RepID=UPI00382CF4F5
MKTKVIDILEDYLEWEIIKTEKDYTNLPQKDKEELRLAYDNDAKYYYETINLNKETALRADTITSFWTLYKRLLELEAGWSAYKTTKSLERLIFQTNKTRINDYTDKIRKVNEKIKPFAELCYTKGNYMLLPQRDMNKLRYNLTEDRIDWTLYECFDDGKLTSMFKDKQHLHSWIDEQNLTSLFVNSDKNKDNIKWFVNADKPKLISKMNTNEIYQYLENAILLIKERNNVSVK